MDIQIQHTNIGSITFRQEPPTAQRTAEGFLITLPLTMRLAPVEGKIPMVTGLRGTLLQANGTSGPDEIGRLRSDHLYQGASTDHEFPASMDWHGTLTALAEYERLRNGRPPSWTVRIAGEVHLLTFVPGQALQLGPAPFTFHGQEQLRITTEGWTSVVQHLGILDLILIHIPLPDQVPGPMTPVWSALQAARDDYATGGVAGWRGCGIHLRQALTDWEAAQHLDIGKGIADKKALTKDQRLDNLRFHLREFTHIAGHPDPNVAKTWTRDDALLVLSTTCALLNVKKP